MVRDGAGGAVFPPQARAKHQLDAAAEAWIAARVPMLVRLWRAMAVPVAGCIIFIGAMDQWLLLFALPRPAFAAFISMFWFIGAIAGTMVERASMRGAKGGPKGGEKEGGNGSE